MMAAVLESFPETTQTFHHHRLAELHRRGLLDSIWYVRDANGSLPAECLALRDLAKPIPPPRPRDIAAFAKGSLRNALALPTSDNGERGKLGALKHGLYGASLGRVLRADRRVTRIHGMFAAASATTAMIAAEVSGLPLSIEVHAPQSLVTNERWLAHKLQRADDIVAISEYSADEVRRLAPFVGVHVVRCGVPEPAGLTPPAAGEAIDLISVGSLIPKKGHELTIRAAAQLDRPLTIVGDGPLRDVLEQLSTEVGAEVDFRGRLPADQIRSLLAVAQVGVLACVRSDAGDEDGIPVALMEYLQMGLPTVSTHLAGIPELIRDQRIGFLAEPGDLDSLIEAIDLAGSPTPSRASRLPADFELDRSCDALVEALDLEGVA